MTLGPRVIPARSPQVAEYVSDLPFEWDARDRSLDAATGQTGTLSRAGVGRAVRGKNGLYSGRHPDGMARWGMMPDENGKMRDVLALSRGDTGTIDDVVLFDSSSAWTRSSLGSEAVKKSIFASLPPNGEARQLVSQASDNFGYIQQTGTFSGGKEIAVAVAEDDGSATRVELRLRDESTNTILGRAIYDFDKAEFSGPTGDSGHLVLREDGQGENGGREVLLWTTVDTTSGNGRRLRYFFTLDGAGDGSIVAYINHHELAHHPGVIPTVGAPDVVPGDQFSISPGFYTPDQAQAWYVEFFMPRHDFGASGELLSLVAHGDGSNPGMRLEEDNNFEGRLRFFATDGNGNGGISARPRLGSVSAGDRIEVVYVLDPSNGSVRCLAQLNGGGWVQDTDYPNGTRTPADWVTPDGFGSDDRVVCGERADLAGTARNVLDVRSLRCQVASRLTNDLFLALPAELGAEMAALGR